jgi:uncharacterized protein
MREEKTKSELIGLLSSKLSPHLTYHGLHHTIDVHDVCVFYADHYDLPIRETMLLKIAALGHDTGFTEIYADHERVGAEITDAIMDRHGFSKADRGLVGDLILATKIPQNPGSFLAQIICDADLDYLGRDDFMTVGLTLKEEWRHYEIVPSVDENFDKIQIGFLKSHYFHTTYAVKHRSPLKQKHLKTIIERQALRDVMVTD